MTVRTSGLCALAIALLACGGSDDEGEEPSFPAEYAATFEEVRNCRRSIDHDFKHIRVMASPEALAAYRDRVAPFPVGAIVLKEQYGEDDETCAGPLIDYTVMVKLEDGSAPDLIDWAWQEVDADRSVVAVDVVRCAGCHSSCELPEGYLGTCAAP